MTSIGGLFAYVTRTVDMKLLVAGIPSDYVPRTLYRAVAMPHIYAPIILNVILYTTVFILLDKQARRVRALIVPKVNTQVSPRSRKSVNKTPGSNHESRRGVESRRVVRVGMLVLGSMVVCWLPFTVATQMHSLLDPHPPMAWVRFLGWQSFCSSHTPSLTPWCTPGTAPGGGRRTGGCWGWSGARGRERRGDVTERVGNRNRNSAIHGARVNGKEK